MPLDATVGGASANSYLTIAEADALNANRLNYGDRSQAALWAAAVTDTKDDALISATDDIDAYVRTGAIWDADQRLRFPRAIDVDAAAVPFVPWKVKHAVFEQALYLLANQELLEQAQKRRARQMFSFSEGDVSGSIALDSQVGLLSAEAERLLGGYVQTATSRTRIGSVRVRSKYAAPAAVTIT